MSEETVSYYGHCARYCGIALDGELPASGADPAEHGRWCRSASAAADGIDADGRPRTVYVEVNSEYISGEMPADRVPLHNKLNNVIEACICTDPMTPTSRSRRVRLGSSRPRWCTSPTSPAGSISPRHVCPTDRSP
ncbi:hypothetical protein [Gordonia iterans]